MDSSKLTGSLHRRAPLAPPLAPPCPPRQSANRSGENASDFFPGPARRRSAARAPTAELVVTPCPPRPATQNNPFTLVSQPITKRPSDESVLNPAHPRLMLTRESAGM